MKLQLRMFLLVGAALAAGGANPASAQEAAGGYTTRVGGQPFGTETYRIIRSASGSQRAEGDAAFGGMKLKVTTEVGADGRPARFELDANGARDALVLPHHALALAQALSEAGNKRVTLRIFRDLTHLFTPATPGEQAGEVSDEFLRALQEWASATLGRK